MDRSMKTTAATLLLLTLTSSGCAYRFLFWERNIWQDTYGIFAMAEPADLEFYRDLLPDQFGVPDQPMVGLYLVHFIDTEPWPITATEFLLPYYEATILLRCEHDDQIGWYSVVMPVTTKAALIGGHRLGFPKYVADEITLEVTDDGWLGAVRHEGEQRMALRFSAAPADSFTGLTHLQHEFVNGRGDADLKGPVILLIPPGRGPEVNVIPISPPPLTAREAGTVEISLADPYDRLVPEGTLAPALYQRFTLAGGGGPSWTFIVIFVAGLSYVTWVLLRKLRSRRSPR